MINENSSIEIIYKMESFRTPQLQLIHNVLELAKNWHKHQVLAMREFNISHEQLNILITLYYDTDESSLSLSEIQDKMVLPTTNASRLVDKLREKKLVTRKTNRQNRRKVKIQITEKGKITVVKATEKMKKYAEKINTTFDDQEAYSMQKKICQINDIILDWN